MLQGIHLSLMIGPVLPVPAPKAVVDAVQSVQVTSGKDKSGFQITFDPGYLAQATKRHRQAVS